MATAKDRYITVNPDTFDDKDQWSYRDLQKLCMELELGGRGTRLQLVKKLSRWHRGREVVDEDAEIVLDETNDTMPMNVIGNNFSLLPIHVRESKRRRNSVTANKKRRKSILGFKSDDESAVSPTLLKPIINRAEPQTPVRSILKRQNSENTQTPGKLSKLTFSPYNGVCLIPHRLETLEL